MKIVPAKALWDQSLQVGYIGFITREDDTVADGIEYFERFGPGIPFVHTFIVVNSAQVIEAHAGTGVSYGLLSAYLGKKNCQCFIRQPAGWTPAMGAQIVASAKNYLGQKYGYTLIVADALNNSFAGRFLNWAFANQPARFVSWLFDGMLDKICSELVATAMQSVPSLRKGCLVQPARMIMPKPLGNDDQIFEPTTYKLT